MDQFSILFIVVTALTVFAIWKGGGALIKKFKSFKPHVDSSNEFLKSEDVSDLPSEVKRLLLSLEKQRLELHLKNKGLFGRSFFQTWLVLVALAFAGILFFGDAQAKTEPATMIGPLLITAILSLIGAGIYTLIRKAYRKSGFIKTLKQELITELTQCVNPGLTFSEKGIEFSEFKQAVLFKGLTFKSEDQISGTVEGHEVSISECDIQTTVKTSKDNSTTYIYFNGLFVQMDLNSPKWQTSLKVIPRINVDNEIKHESFSFSNVKDLFKNLENPISNQHYGTLEIHHGKKVAEPIFENEKYAVFGSEAVKPLITSNFHKVVDFILAKFNYRDAFISIQNGRFYLAICWNQNMFDPKKILDQNLKDSGVVEQIHRDLLFINQIISEVSLMNKL